MILFTDVQTQQLHSVLGTNEIGKQIHLIQKYKERWELCETQFQPSISVNNLIFYATSRPYGKVIFKILLNDGFDKEIQALRFFQGENFCKLHEYSSEDHVYIMERIAPADSLYESTTRNERIPVIAGIFARLHKPDPPDDIFPTYAEWFASGKNGTIHRGDCKTLFPYLARAERILADLNARYPRRLLLHGDLHHENILKNKNGGYTVIDPKGVVGDPVFDLSRFILDEFRDDLTSEPGDAVIGFVKTLGYHVGIPCDVLLGCLFVETVIWLFREELAAGKELSECRSLIANMKMADAFVHHQGAR